MHRQNQMLIDLLCLSSLDANLTILELMAINLFARTEFSTIIQFGAPTCLMKENRLQVKNPPPYLFVVISHDNTNLIYNLAELNKSKRLKHKP